MSTAALVMVSAATSARAAPGTSATDPEGGTAALHQQLDAAARGYLDAKVRLENSTKRQRELTQQLTAAEAELAQLQVTVGEVARAAYRTGRLGPMSALLNSGSAGDLIQRAASLDAIAASNNKQLSRLADAQKRTDQAKTAIDTEVKQQTKQLAVMAKRKQDAEAALQTASSTSTGGTQTAPPASSPAPSVAPPAAQTGTPPARKAPRNADGSLPAESCTVDDPTTTGCITPRTLNALQQAKAAGFTRFVSCFRSGGSGEHPKGRACDFAAAKNTFGGVASGDERTYGNNLAAYFVNNASRLGVLYVIWFKQIWMESTGWRAYTKGNGDPASDHTNHVHLSVQ
jgi:phage shock protein A